MRVLAYLLALLLGGMGLLFLVGNQGLWARAVVGGVLLVSALVLAAVVRLRPVEKRVVQRIDLSGDVHLESLRCQRCGAELDASAVRVEAGAVFVACPYCKAAYQIEEAPKW